MGGERTGKIPEGEGGMTKEEVFLHYIKQAEKVFPGKSKAAKEARLLAAYDLACSDIAKLLEKRRCKE